MKKKGLLFGMAVGLLAASVFSWATDSKKDTDSYLVTNTDRYEVLNNRHTQYTEVQEAKNLLSTEGFEEKMNNGILSVWYNEEMQALRMVDLRSGYVWGCIDDKDEYGLNKKWTKRGTSMLYITYFNMDGKEEGCALSDNTFRADFDWKKDNFSCKVTAKKLGISFTFTGTLKEDAFTFAMEDKSIKESGRGKLGTISFASFMGSVFEDTIPGYMMVPDGSGALIRFQKAKAYQTGYSRRVYGTDRSIEKDNTSGNLNGNRTDDYATEEHTLALPLWGMVHGEQQNGFLATIDSGDLYAVINAIPAGAENQTVKFSRAYADFIYRSQYNKRVSSSKTIAQPQEEKNEVNPSLTFTFLTGEKADYSGMAECYRNRLLEAGLLPENEIAKEGDITLLLHVAGSEVKEGFLSNGLAKLTNVDQAEQMLDGLKEQGITEISMLLSGWNAGGYHGASFGSTKFEKRVGTRKEVEDLQERLQKQGGSLALVMNLVTANQDQISVSRDTALNATLDAMVKTIPNKGLMYQDTYYVRHDKKMKFLKQNLDELEGFSVLLEDMASQLHADYTINEEVTRKQVKEGLMKATEAATQDLYFDATNLYFLKYASQLIDVPVSGSQYVYETDSVPFLQMVIRGTVEYYAPYSNLGFYSNASILKMIEYGAYPSFMVMHADNFELSDTPLENYFSLNFQDWEEKICNVYGQVNEALSHVKGASITEHRAVAEGVYCTMYDNGVRIYVNYNSEDYVTEEGVTVLAGSYAVEGLK